MTRSFSACDSIFMSTSLSSVPSYVFCSSAPKMLAATMAVSFCENGTATTASAYLGIAFLRLPPFMWAILTPHCSLSLFRYSPIIFIELPLFLLMSSPECPPTSPLTVTEKKYRLSLGSSVSNFSSPMVSLPPAHPMQNSPSSSESRLMSVLAFSQPSFMLVAPYRPVSSSTVNRHSSSLFLTVSDFSMANAIAMPMPSSAPRVVPSAVSHSPSIFVFIGSFSQSWLTPSSFSQTMSMCACSAIGARPL